METNDPTIDDGEIDLGWPTPEYLIEGTTFGISIDDSCYIVLHLDVDGLWELSQWIPPLVAKRLGEIADLGTI